MISVELDTFQTRSIAVQHISHELIIHKQYLSQTQIENYKFMLKDFATLTELDQISERFEKEYPTDVKW